MRKLKLSEPQERVLDAMADGSLISLRTKDGRPHLYFHEEDRLFRAEVSGHGFPVATLTALLTKDLCCVVRFGWKTRAQFRLNERGRALAALRSGKRPEEFRGDSLRHAAALTLQMRGFSHSGAYDRANDGTAEKLRWILQSFHSKTLPEEPK